MKGARRNRRALASKPPAAGFASLTRESQGGHSTPGVITSTGSSRFSGDHTSPASSIASSSASSAIRASVSTELLHPLPPTPHNAQHEEQSNRNSTTTTPTLSPHHRSTLGPEEDDWGELLNNVSSPRGSVRSCRSARSTASFTGYGNLVSPSRRTRSGVDTSLERHLTVTLSEPHSIVDAVQSEDFKTDVAEAAEAAEVTEVLAVPDEPQVRLSNLLNDDLSLDETAERTSLVPKDASAVAVPEFSDQCDTSDQIGQIDSGSQLARHSDGLMASFPRKSQSSEAFSLELQDSHLRDHNLSDQQGDETTVDPFESTAFNAFSSHEFTSSTAVVPLEEVDGLQSHECSITQGENCSSSVAFIPDALSDQGDHETTTMSTVNVPALETMSSNSCSEAVVRRELGEASVHLDSLQSHSHAAVQSLSAVEAGTNVGTSQCANEETGQQMFSKVDNCKATCHDVGLLETVGGPSSNGTSQEDCGRLETDDTSCSIFAGAGSAKTSPKTYALENRVTRYEEQTDVTDPSNFVMLRTHNEIPGAEVENLDREIACSMSGDTEAVQPEYIDDKTNVPSFLTGWDGFDGWDNCETEEATVALSSGSWQEEMGDQRDEFRESSTKASSGEIVVDPPLKLAVEVESKSEALIDQPQTSALTMEAKHEHESDLSMDNNVFVESRIDSSRERNDVESQSCCNPSSLSEYVSSSNRMRPDEFAPSSAKTFASQDLVRSQDDTWNNWPSQSDTAIVSNEIPSQLEEWAWNDGDGNEVSDMVAPCTKTKFKLNSFTEQAGRMCRDKKEVPDDHSFEKTCDGQEWALASFPSTIDHIEIAQDRPPMEPLKQTIQTDLGSGNQAIGMASNDAAFVNNERSRAHRSTEILLPRDDCSDSTRLASHEIIRLEDRRVCLSDSESKDIDASREVCDEHPSNRGESDNSLCNHLDGMERWNEHETSACDYTLSKELTPCIDSVVESTVRLSTGKGEVLADDAKDEEIYVLNVEEDISKAIMKSEPEATDVDTIELLAHGRSETGSERITHGSPPIFPSNIIPDTGSAKDSRNSPPDNEGPSGSVVDNMSVNMTSKDTGENNISPEMYLTPCDNKMIDHGRFAQEINDNADNYEGKERLRKCNDVFDWNETDGVSLEIQASPRDDSIWSINIDHSGASTIGSATPHRPSHSLTIVSSNDAADLADANGDDDSGLMDVHSPSSRLCVSQANGKSSTDRAALSPDILEFAHEAVSGFASSSFPDDNNSVREEANFASFNDVPTEASRPEAIHGSPNCLRTEACTRVYGALSTPLMQSGSRENTAVDPENGVHDSQMSVSKCVDVSTRVKTLGGIESSEVQSHTITTQTRPSDDSSAITLRDPENESVGSGSTTERRVGTNFPSLEVLNGDVSKLEMNDVNNSNYDEEIEVTSLIDKHYVSDERPEACTEASPVFCIAIDECKDYQPGPCNAGLPVSDGTERARIQSTIEQAPGLPALDESKVSRVVPLASLDCPIVSEESLKASGVLSFSSAYVENSERESGALQPMDIEFATTHNDNLASRIEYDGLSSSKLHRRLDLNELNSDQLKKSGVKAERVSPTVASAASESEHLLAPAASTPVVKPLQMQFDVARSSHPDPIYSENKSTLMELKCSTFEHYVEPLPSLSAEFDDLRRTENNRVLANEFSEAEQLSGQGEYDGRRANTPAADKLSDASCVQQPLSSSLFESFSDGGNKTCNSDFMNSDIIGIVGNVASSEQNAVRNVDAKDVRNFPNDHDSEDFASVENMEDLRVATSRNGGMGDSTQQTWATDPSAARGRASVTCGFGDVSIDDSRAFFEHTQFSEDNQSQADATKDVSMFKPVIHTPRIHSKLRSELQTEANDFAVDSHSETRDTFTDFYNIGLEPASSVEEGGLTNDVDARIPVVEESGTSTSVECFGPFLGTDVLSTVKNTVDGQNVNSYYFDNSKKVSAKADEDIDIDPRHQISKSRSRSELHKISSELTHQSLRTGHGKVPSDTGEVTWGFPSTGEATPGFDLGEITTGKEVSPAREAAAAIEHNLFPGTRPSKDSNREISYDLSRNREIGEARREQSRADENEEQIFPPRDSCHWNRESQMQTSLDLHALGHCETVTNEQSETSLCDDTICVPVTGAADPCQPSEFYLSHALRADPSLNSTEDVSVPGGDGPAVSFDYAPTSLDGSIAEIASSEKLGTSAADTAFSRVAEPDQVTDAVYTIGSPAYHPFAPLLREKKEQLRPRRSGDLYESFDAGNDVAPAQNYSHSCSTSGREQYEVPGPMFSIMSSGVPVAVCDHPPRAVVSWGFGGSLIVVTSRSVGTQDDREDSWMSESLGHETGHRRTSVGVVRMFDIGQIAAECGDDDWNAVRESWVDTSARTNGTSERSESVLKFSEMCDRLSQISPSQDRLHIETRAAMWRVLATLCRRATGRSEPDIASALSSSSFVPLYRGQGPSALAEAVGESSSVNFSKFAHSPREEEVSQASRQVEELLVSGRGIEAVSVARHAGLWSLALISAAAVDRGTYLSTMSSFARTALSSGTALQIFCLAMAEDAEEIKRIATSSAGLKSWRKTLAALVTCKKSSYLDSELCSSVIDMLGDAMLRTENDVVGAHLCYLVSGRISGLKPFGMTEKDVEVLGASSTTPSGRPFSYGSGAAILKSIVLEEICMTRGEHNFVHLLPLKLVLAKEMAVLGRTVAALHLCDKIVSAVRSLLSGNAETSLEHLTPPFLASLEDFENQLRVHLGHRRLSENDRPSLMKLPATIDKFRRRVASVTNFVANPLEIPVENHRRSLSASTQLWSSDTQSGEGRDSKMVGREVDSNNSAKWSSRSVIARAIDTLAPDECSPRAPPKTLSVTLSAPVSQYSPQVAPGYASGPQVPVYMRPELRQHDSLSRSSLEAELSSLPVSNDIAREDTPTFPSEDFSSAPTARSDNSLHGKPPLPPSTSGRETKISNSAEKDVGRPKSSGKGWGLRSILQRKLVEKLPSLLGNRKQAHLGEKNSFIYSKELGRWVEEGQDVTDDNLLPPPPPEDEEFEGLDNSAASNNLDAISFSRPSEYIQEMKTMDAVLLSTNHADASAQDFVAYAPRPETNFGSSSSPHGLNASDVPPSQSCDPVGVPTIPSGPQPNFMNIEQPQRPSSFAEFDSQAVRSRSNPAGNRFRAGRRKGSAAYVDTFNRGHLSASATMSGPAVPPSVSPFHVAPHNIFTSPAPNVAGHDDSSHAGPTSTS